MKWLKVVYNGGIRYFNAAQISDLSITADNKSVILTVQTGATTAVYTLPRKAYEEVAKHTEEVIQAIAILTDPTCYGVYTLDLTKFAAAK